MRTGQQRSSSIRDLLLNFRKSSISKSSRASASTYCARPASVSRDGLFLDFLLPPSVFPLPVYTRYAYRESVRPSYFRPSYKDFRIGCSKGWDAFKACSSGQTQQLFSFLSGRLPFDRHPKSINTRLDSVASFSATSTLLKEQKPLFPQCDEYSDVLKSTPVGLPIDPSQDQLSMQAQNLDVFEDLYTSYKSSDRSPTSRLRFFQTLLVKTRPIPCFDASLNQRSRQAIVDIFSLQPSPKRLSGLTEAEALLFQQLCLQCTIRFSGAVWVEHQKRSKQIEETTRQFFLRASEASCLSIFQEASFSCRPEDYLLHFIVRHDGKYKYLYRKTLSEPAFYSVWRSLDRTISTSAVFPYQPVGHLFGKQVPLSPQDCINTFFKTAQDRSMPPLTRERHHIRAAEMFSDISLGDDASLSNVTMPEPEVATALGTKLIKDSRYRQAWSVLKFCRDESVLLKYNARWPTIAVGAHHLGTSSRTTSHTASVNTILHEQYHSDQAEAAFSLLQREYPLDRTVGQYSIVLRGLARRADVGRAVRLWKDLKSQHHLKASIDTRMWTQMLSVYVNRADWKAAMELFADAQKAGIAIDLAMWTTMMKVHAGANQYTQALEIFGRLRQSKDADLKPDIATYNIALKCLLLSGAPVKRLLDVVSTFPDLNIRPDEFTITTLLQSAASGGHMATAESIFAQADKSSSQIVKLSTHHFAIMIKAFLENGEKEAARLYLKEMARRSLPDTSIFAANLVNAYLNDEEGADLPEAEEVISQYSSKFPKTMEPPGYDKPADQRAVYSSLLTPVIHHFAKQMKVTDALRTFRRIGEQGEQPTIITYSALLNAYRLVGNVDAVLQIWDVVFERGCQDFPPAMATETELVRGAQLCMPLSIVIQALADVDRHQDIVDRWLQVQDSGFGFDAANWNHLCQATIRARQLKHALWIMETVLLPEETHVTKSSDPIVGKRRLREIFDPTQGDTHLSATADGPNISGHIEKSLQAENLFAVEDPDPFAVYRQTLDMMSDAINSKNRPVEYIDGLWEKYPKAMQACKEREASMPKRAHERHQAPL